MMNNNTIVDFKLGDNKGIFVSIPYFLKIFKIDQYRRLDTTYLIGTSDEEGSDHHMFMLPKGEYKYIGRSHELSPEFVEYVLKVSFNEYINILNKHGITINYSDDSNFWAVLLTER